MDKGISSLGKIKGKRYIYGEKGKGRGKCMDKGISSDKGRDKRPRPRRRQIRRDTDKERILYIPVSRFRARKESTCFRKATLE